MTINHWEPGPEYRCIHCGKRVEEHPCHIERKLILPTIHLNGTSKRELQEQVENAYMAVRDAMDALRKATPNGRDYYPQGPTVFTLAVAQHQEQFNKLEEVATYLDCIAEGIA